MQELSKIPKARDASIIVDALNDIALEQQILDCVTLQMQLQRQSARTREENFQWNIVQQAR